MEKDFWVTEVLRGTARRPDSRSASLKRRRSRCTCSHRRTLVEKLMIVHHAAVEGDEAEQARLARHYYDIWCLLNDADTVAALSETPVDVLEREVVTFTRAAELETTRRPVTGFATSPAFDPTAAQSARSAFETIVLDQLVWPDAPRPTFEECCALVVANESIL